MKFLFWVGIAIFLIPSLTYAYFLMPFPGSQDTEAISMVYTLHKILPYTKGLAIALILFPLFKVATKGSKRAKISFGLGLMACLLFLFFTEIKFKAEKMFEEPQSKLFKDVKENEVADSLIIVGVVKDGIAKAYPLNYLGYHHKVQDSIGDQALLATYCTMCRTARVFSPVINKKYEKFRLVGARHYNAVIEDEGTGSWWYQATGEAAEGPLKGKKLLEIPYEQTTLKSWVEKYPHTLILQPDKKYQKNYDDLKRYDRLQPIDKDSTIKKDSLIRKSWVIGLTWNNISKAFDWKEAIKVKIINDQVGDLPVVIAIENDTMSFHVWSRVLQGKVYTFKPHASGLTDLESASIWNWKGECVEGENIGKKLISIPAHQEYWHSWRFFPFNYGILA